MTNLGFYGADAVVYDTIRIYMTGNWLTDWHNSGEKDLIKWLLMEHKETYKLSKFEYDLLLAVKKWSGGEQTIEQFFILRNLKEKGYFKNVDIEKTVAEILENCEVISDD